MALAPLMAPLPTVVKAIVVPVRAPPTVIGALATVSIKESVPPAAFMAAVAAMPPAAVSVRLNPPVPIVDAPFVVSA